MQIDLTTLSPTERERVPRTPTLLLDKRHAAMALSISERKLDLLVEAGEFPKIQIGKQCPRFYVLDLIAWIERTRDAQTSHADTDAA